MYPSVFFRKQKDMNDIELAALNSVQGKILDVGAGAGCHSLVLQLLGHEVTALESSKQSCEVMRQRGLKQVVQSDIMHFSEKNTTPSFYS